MRILIIEDEPGLQKVLKKGLKYECFAVDVAPDGKQGAFLGKNGNYDAIILDYMLPEKTGAEVCREIRQIGKDTPILVLSALSDTDKKIEMLNAGADDYLTKPFSIDELVARVRALLRRPGTVEKDIIKIGPLQIEMKKHLVKMRNKKIKLTRKEFMLLEYLAKNKGQVLSRGRIMEHVWDLNADPFSNTIESHILSLRKKLGDRGKNRIIKTVAGRGYKIEDNNST